MISFQQNNDPKHTCKKVKEWLEEQDFRTMVWPAQSPDLNSIEYLWGWLKRRLAELENPPKWIHELWNRVQVEWERIPVVGKDMGMGNPHGLWVWVSMGMSMGWYQPTHESIPITHGQPMGLFQL